MAQAIRRPERWDHPFDPARQELVRLDRAVELFPDDAGLQTSYEDVLKEAVAYVDRLLQVAPFNSIMTGEHERETLRQILLSDTRVRRYRKGELVVRQGDYGNSAFVVLTGSVRVVLQPLSASQVGRQAETPRSLFSSFLQWLVRPGGEQRDLSSVEDIYRQAHRDDHYIPIFLQDVPRVIKNFSTVVLGEGELFGEISALGRTPRTASVFADADDAEQGGKTVGGTELLEIRWQGLRDLMNADRGFKEHLFVLYRRNALGEHLRETPILRRVGDTPEIRKALADQDFRTLFAKHLGWEAREETLMATDAAPQEARSYLRFNSGALSGQVVPLDTSKVLTLGRSNDAGLQITGDMTLSRIHASLSYEDGNWTLRNLSRYGTVFEGRTMRGNEVLRSGNSFSLGKTAITFEVEETQPAHPNQSGVKSFNIQMLALAPERRGFPEVAAFLCHAPDGHIPAPGTRRTIESHIKRQRPGPHIIIFAGKGSATQVWQWTLPEEGDPASNQPREVTLRKPADRERLVKGLFHKLALNEIAKETELQSHGEFTWSRRSLQEAEGGIDWTKRAQKEPVIVAEGSYPNGVILIRAGFARRSRKYNHGQRTLDYLGRGRDYGFQEIAHNWRNPDAAVQMQHTLTALGYVDVLVVPTSTLERFVLPSIPKSQLPPPIVIQEEQQEPAQTLQATEHVADGLREFLVQRRFVNGTAAMLIDLDRCTRCDDCVRACASTHQNNPRFLRHGPIFGNHMVANACMHCADPVCMIGCPTGAISRSVGGQVTINDPTCIGCATCAGNCPYDNIRMVEIRNARGNFILDEQNKPHRRATKCDLCFDQAAGPACVRACPHDAMGRIDLNSLSDLSKWLS